MEDDSCVLNYIEIVPLIDKSCSDVSAQLCPVKVSVSAWHSLFSKHVFVITW